MNSDSNGFIEVVALIALAPVMQEYAKCILQTDYKDDMKARLLAIILLRDSYFISPFA